MKDGGICHAPPPADFGKMQKHARLNLSLLGPRLKSRLAIATEGARSTPLYIGSRKARALLYFLALQAEAGATRDLLASLLWGDRVDDLARQNLRQCIASLRKDLAAVRATDLFIVDGDVVALRRELFIVDANEFAVIANSNQLGDLERAATLYRGEFLAGNSLEIPSFCDWVREQRDRFQTLAARVLQEYAKQMETRGRGETALDAATRLVALDPLREDWQRLLLELLARHRGCGSAIAQARALTGLLRKELDVEPAAATKALIADIERRDVASIFRPLASPAETPSRRLNVSHVRFIRPSIAVCRFVDLSEDARNEAFVGGMLAELITALTWIKSLAVVASDSAVDRRHRAVGGAPIGRELGVDYLLQGSVRRAGARVCVTAHLVDGGTGNHIWAQRYDGEIGDMFAMQGDIAAKIAATVEPHVYVAEGARAGQQMPQALNVRGCVMRAFSLINIRSKQNYALAQRLLKRAIEIDPHCAQAYSVLAYVTALDVVYGWKPRENNLALASDAAEKAVLCDVDHPWGYLAAGFVHAQNRQTEQAIEEYNKALALNPNFGLAHTYLGSALSHLGRTAEALAQIDAAERLSPRELFFGVNNYVRANANFAAEQHREASVFARKSVWESPGIVTSHRQLVVNCALAGEMDEARAVLESLRHLVPDISLEAINDALPYGRDSDKSRFLDAFRLLGVE